MRVYYLEHSGFVVNIGDYSFIFDAISEIPGEFVTGKKVFFFVSHSHGDHFKRAIYRHAGENVYYILSDDVPSPGDLKNRVYVAPYDSITVEGVSLKTFGSTDQGVSFLLYVGGKTIFFAGDLNWWAWDPKTRPHIDPAVEERDYKNEITKLKAELAGKPLDLAFIPVDPRLDLPGGTYFAAKYLVEELAPEKLVPMHFWGKYGVIEELVKILAPTKTAVGRFTHNNEEVKF